jgi:hypothetical protein
MQLAQIGGTGDWQAPAHDDNDFAPTKGNICNGVPSTHLPTASTVPSSLEVLRAIVDEATAMNIHVAEGDQHGLECGVRSTEHNDLMAGSSIPLVKRQRAFDVPPLVTYRTQPTGPGRCRKRHLWAASL